jgi:DNA-binding transcriptional ArsR family regulator
VDDAEAALRALAHPVRRRMLELLWDIELASSDLAHSCAVSRPAASQHLRVLLNADLVAVRVRGNQRLYRVRLDQLVELRTLLDAFWGKRLDTLDPEGTGERAPAVESPT